MQFLKISNAGEIENTALTLMGATTKRDDDSQIGYFGTGNKYAIAWLAKQNIPFRIFSGLREIVVDTVPVTLEGKQFEAITIDGQSTSLTTGMGPRWEAWDVVREIYCNAIDSGSHDWSTRSGDQVTGEIGRTSFYIEIRDSIQSIIDNFDNYFARARAPLFTCADGSIYPSRGAGIYRKGIRCVDKPKLQTHDYDLENLTLSENRRAEYNFEIVEGIWGLIAKSNDASIIDRAISVSVIPEYLEAGISHCNPPVMLSRAWGEFFKTSVVAAPDMQVLMTKEEIATTRFMPLNLISATKKFLGEDIITWPESVRNYSQDTSDLSFKIIDNESNDQTTLTHALRFLSKAGIDTSEYRTFIAKFGNKRILGYADSAEKAIFVSDTVFAMGFLQVCGTIVEEYIHLKYEAKDETRFMQDCILNEFMLTLSRLLPEYSHDLPIGATQEIVNV